MLRALGTLTVTTGAMAWLAACSWGSGDGSGCFRAGTMVATANGERAIETVVAGDEVLAFDAAKGEVVLGMVDELQVREAGELGALRLASGVTLSVTREHPFYLPAEGRWVPAEELTAGMELLAHDGGPRTRRVAVAGIAFATGAKEPVYNLKVRRYENSFAGGVLAHFY